MIKINKISKHKWTHRLRYGPPGVHLVVKGNIGLCAPFITQDFWLFNNASNQETKFLPKPNFFKTARMNLWPSEANAFSLSIVTKNPPILLQSHIFSISVINLPPSLINLFLIYAVCCVEIKLERTFFSLSERTF